MPVFRGVDASHQVEENRQEVANSEIGQKYLHQPIILLFLRTCNHKILKLLKFPNVVDQLHHGHKRYDNRDVRIDEEVDGENKNADRIDYEPIVQVKFGNLHHRCQMFAVFIALGCEVENHINHIQDDTKNAEVQEKGKTGCLWECHHD